jgi:GGDEF domain-containing protein
MIGGYQALDKVLLYGDTDAVKEFVFESSSLPQVRGGSTLLQMCEEKVKELICRRFGWESVVFCSGGGFLFEVPAEAAPALKKEIEELYLRETKTATVTVVYEESPPPSLGSGFSFSGGWAGRLVSQIRDYPPGDFGRRVSFLVSRLRSKKMGKIQAPFFEAFPFAQRCGECGRRIAEERAGPEEKPLCAVCGMRYRFGQLREKNEKVRGVFNQKFFDYLEKKFAEEKEKTFLLEKCIQPPDLDNLVQSARRHKYLAFVYADGNDMGGLFRRMKSRDEYRAVSDALKKGTEEALFETLAEIFERSCRLSQCWPFEIINVGGDDVTFLVQGGFAWEAAVNFLGRFEEKVRKNIGEKLGGWPVDRPEVTVSCGIVVADQKYPLYFFEKLAADALQKAKKLAKKERSRPQSAVHFLWLPNPVAGEKVDPFLDRYHQVQRGGEDFVLTSRPYTLEQARLVGDLAAKCSTWSRSLRRQWGEALESGVFSSRLAILYNLVRQKEGQRQKIREWFFRFQDLFPGDTGTGTYIDPWRREESEKEDVYRTALLDVLELAELFATRPGTTEVTD